MNKLFKNKKGFTLVELIVVIAILGILANGLTILQMPSYMQNIITGGIIILAVIAQRAGHGDAA